MNKNRRILSLAVPCFVFSFKSRKSQQTLSLIFNTKSTSKNVFYLKSKLNSVSVIALPDWQLLYQYQKIQFCIQLYIDIWKIIPYLQANPY